MDMFTSPEFWLAVGQIILIDILLGGDNAVVIALACRKLPPNLRTKGIMWGTAGAIVLRVVLIFFALTLLKLPFLKLVGGALLLWIGIKLLMPEAEDDHSKMEASDKLWGAVKTVKLMDKFPIVITLGAMLLGWIAGTMLVTDPALNSWVPMQPGDKPGTTEVLPQVYYALGVGGALFVLIVGKLLAARKPAEA